MWVYLRERTEWINLDYVEKITLHYMMEKVDIVMRKDFITFKTTEEGLNHWKQVMMNLPGSVEM
jgi:hypothetical protein